LKSFWQVFPFNPHVEPNSVKNFSKMKGIQEITKKRQKFITKCLFSENPQRHIYEFLIFNLGFWGRVLLCSLGWPETCDSLASTSLVLELLACIIMHWLMFLYPDYNWSSVKIILKNLTFHDLFRLQVVQTDYLEYMTRLILQICSRVYTIVIYDLFW
jgi:hypothetical protein